MTRSYRIHDERPTVTYGPRPSGEGWVLTVSTERGRVEIVLDDEQAMYDLWTEVRGVPWPTVATDGERAEQDRLVRQLVHAANGADTEMLRDALDVLGVGRDD